MKGDKALNLAHFPLGEQKKTGKESFQADERTPDILAKLVERAVPMN